VKLTSNFFQSTSCGYNGLVHVSELYLLYCCFRKAHSPNQTSLLFVTTADNSLWTNDSNFYCIPKPALKPCMVMYEMSNGSWYLLCWEGTVSALLWVVSSKHYLSSLKLQYHVMDIKK